MQPESNSVINDDVSFCIIPEENMFKISKGYTTVSKTIRITEDKAEYLENLASEHNISFNKLINQCIDFALKNFCPDKPEKTEKKK